MESKLYYRLYTISHLSQSWAKSIQITLSEKIYLIFILSNIILPSAAWSSKWSFPSVFPLKSCVHLSSPPSCHMLRPSASYRFVQPDNSWWGVQVMKHLTVQSFPVPCYLVPYWSERLPKHPVLEHPAPTFFLQYERPSFRPYKTTGQIVVLYVSIRTFLKQTAKQKIPDRMVADIPRVSSALNP